MIVYQYIRMKHISHGGYLFDTEGFKGGSRERPRVVARGAVEGYLEALWGWSEA